MRNQKRKQIAALVRIREHKDSIARRNLQSQMESLRAVHNQAAKKKELVAQLSNDLYNGLEERFLTHTNVTDPGAAFTTFAMSVNAARENLILEEGLSNELDQTLADMRVDVAELRSEVKKAHIELKKAEHVSNVLQEEYRKRCEVLDEALTDEVALNMSVYKT